ncbi:cytochrome P450 [Streptomyces sp. SID685]|uniref:cytochrome P450 family protein n=1 Tax=Streptomyces TaxID=1883 RepID=UPI001369FC48|nr:cytochrome P450 [Streptomyces sp. SID685]
MTAAQVSPLFSREWESDPRPTYRQLHADGSIHRITLPSGSQAWLVTRYEDAVAALANPSLIKDPLRFGKRSRGILSRLPDRLRTVLFRNILEMDPPEHTRVRRLVARPFSAARIGRRLADVQSRAVAMVDALPSREPVDIVSAFCSPYPLRIVCDLLGVPDSEESRLRVQRWARVLNAGHAADGDAYVQCAQEAMEHLEDLVALKRREPGDDLASAMVASQDEEDGLSLEEIIGTLFMLILAGHESTAHLLSMSLLELALNPELRRDLADHPELLPNAAEELLRYTSPVKLAPWRYAAHDLELDGTDIREGEGVMVGVAAANMDPDTFPDPGRLDIRRAEAARHLSFGRGIHFCLGAQLAKMETVAALRAVLARFPDFSPAVPAESIEWQRGAMIRGPLALPLIFEGR